MWRLLTPLYGSQPAAEFFAPDTTQRHILGTMVTGVDPYWGAGEFVYGKAAGTQAMGRLTTPDMTWTFSDAVSTAGLGRPIYTAIYPMLINQFGWYQCSGAMVLSAGAAAAADAAVGIHTGAGQASGTVVAGKQILNYVNKLPVTTTVTKLGRLINGVTKLELVGKDFGGWFHGVTLTTSPALTTPLIATITAFDSDQRTVTMSVAPVIVAADLPSGLSRNIIGTYTGFIVGIGNRPFTQGQIV